MHNGVLDNDSDEAKSLFGSVHRQLEQWEMDWLTAFRTIFMAMSSHMRSFLLLRIIPWYANAVNFINTLGATDYRMIVRPPPEFQTYYICHLSPRGLRLAFTLRHKDQPGGWAHWMVATQPDHLSNCIGLEWGMN